MIDRRRFLQAMALGAAGSTALTGWAVAVEPHMAPHVARWDMPLPRWPADAPPLRLALLSDIHAVEPWTGVGRLEAIVAAANRLAVDMILLLGDYRASISVGRPVAVADIAAALGRLSAPLGVHGILGNHDYVDGDGGAEVLREFRAAGIDMLANEARHVRAAGHDFWLTGTESTLIGAPNGRRSRADLRATLARVRDDRPILHMAHEPRLFARMPDRVALTMSGHTHGGQVSLPGLDGLVGRRFLRDGWVRGPYAVGDGRLVVSSGLGMTFLPVRFGVPPEITVVTVRAPDIA